MTKSTCSLSKILVVIALAIELLLVGAMFSTAQETPATKTELPVVETETPAPVPLPPIDPRRSFSRLAHPSVASRVHLTDAQSVEIQRLLAERAQQLAKAPADQWNTVIHANEKLLEAILTPPQRALWEKVFSEKTIRPIFKFQNWEQVLSWTAEQVGLQLVMDSPPPGTFDYAADRDYTPTEYLDMLNSVLQRKGYALVRYQKMLMLFNLARGKIPVQFLPKVKPQDLDERGAFEFVTCTFSLERRDQAAVILSMTPFQGQYFSYIPMPGNSLLVTDTVGNLQVMWKVAEAVNNPPPPEQPKQPDPPKPPPAPVWETYTITGIDVLQAEKIIKEFVGDTKVLRVENSTDVHYLTQPGNHATIKQIVEIINKDGSDVTRRTVVAYTLEAMRMSMMQRGFRQRINQWQQGGIVQNRDEATATAASVVTFLKDMLPTAVVVPQPIMGKVVVFAEEADHTKIREFFESLAQQTEPPAESRIEARVYRPANTTSSRSLLDTVQAISTLIPSATVTAESSQGVVIVVGTVAEHELVADTFSGMEALADDRVASTYSTKNLPASQVQALVAQSRQDGVFASTLIIPDTQRRRVIVFGTEKQHAEVTKLLGAPLTAEEMTQASRDAIVYTPTALSPSTLSAIVRDMFPDLEVSRDNDRIVVRGTPAEVAEVRALLTQIDQGESGQQYPKTYPLKNAAPLAIMQMINRLYQDATATYDYANRSVMVEASRITHEKIETLLASLDPDEPSPNALEVKFYPLYARPTETLLSPLRQMVPAAQIVTDTRGKQIMVIARPSDQKLVAEHLATILESFSIPEEPVLQIYTVSADQKRRIDAFIVTVRTELPTVRVVADTTPGQLSVWATPTEHALIETILDQLASSENELVPSFKAFSFSSSSKMTTAQQLITSRYPGAQVFPDPVGRRLLIWASESMLDKIHDAMQIFDDPREIRTFVINHAEPYSMISMISRLYPNAIPSYDRLNHTIIVEANVASLDKIEKLLASLDSTEKSPNAAEVKFYSLYTKPTETLLSPLRQLVPTAQIVPDVQNKQIMVIARPIDQKIVAENLETILASFTVPEEPLLQIYTVSSEQKRRIVAFITTARAELPSVQVVADTTPGQLSVWATPKEHELLDTVLTQLADSEGENDLVLQIYHAIGTTTATLQSLVREIYPGLKMTDDMARRRILVWATPEEHVRIGQVVEQANASTIGDPTAELTETFISYNVSGMEITSLTKILESFLPNLPIQSDAASGRIVVLARSREHERIRELIEQLKATDAHRLCSLRAYPYGDSNPVMLEAYLRGAFPEAESFSSDDLVQQLSQSFMMERFWSRYQQSSRRGIDTTTKQTRNGFYKVDTKSRSVYAYLSEDDHTLVAKSIEEITAVAGLEASKTLTRRYVLEETSFYEVQDLFSQIAPSAIFRPLYTPTGRQGSRNWAEAYRDFLVYATESDQQKIEQLVSELNEATSAMGRREVITLSIPSGTRISRVKLIEALTRLYPATDPAEGSEPHQVVLWARSHLKERINAVFAELCRDVPESDRAFIKNYSLKYISATQAVRWIKDLCPNASVEEGGAARGTMAPAVTTAPRGTANSPTVYGLIALATTQDHEAIAKALREIDVPLTSDVEPTPKVYDLSSLPFNYLSSNVISLRQAMPRIVVLGTGVPGQIVVWGTDDEHRKVASVLQQVLAESPETLSQMEIYTLANGFTTEIRQLVARLIPNAILTDGTQINQLVVWAKPADQKKVKDLIDRLQKEEAARDVAFYPVPVGMVYLVYSTVRDYISYRGLAADLTYDYAGNRLMVVATAEEQEIVAKLIGEVGTRETDFEVFSLRSVDLESAQMGLNALFASESYYTRPTVETDVYSNTIFVQGTKQQIDAARKTLVKMGETHLLEDSMPQSTVPRERSGQIRVLKIEGGNLVNTIRELERLWPQMSASPLVIQREGHPLIQKKEEGSNSNSGQFSVPDRAANDANDSVYMTIGDDGSLTIVSYDETALDLLEEALTRINSRIVDEGRDYTIYSVKNISAALVYQKIQLVMRSRMQTRIQWQQQAARYGRSPQSVIPLEILPDLTTNTIYVRGSRVDRQEVGRLITMYDVSDLPGERTVRKPIYVTIQNAEALRIYQQVMNVYQQKMQSTSLPGGVMPRITIDQLTNSLVIIAPEPLATELKEYAEDLDKRIMTEPGRKIQVIQLEVKGAVIRQAIQVIRQSQSGSQMGGGGMMPRMGY